jgi:AcrR family transcriptional regulator
VARPRKVSDEAIFEAAYGVMQRLGPSKWTLADVAAEASLTPGALVQRFGSKRGLLVTLIARFADAAPGMYDELRSRHASALGALDAYVEQTACLAASPETFAHHLDYLRLDLTDPAMRVHFRRHAEAARAFVRETLADAAARGELRRKTDVAALARMVETALTGSLFTWAAYREGPAREWLRRDVEAVLAPHLARRSNTRHRQERAKAGG